MQVRKSGIDAKIDVDFIIEIKKNLLKRGAD